MRRFILLLGAVALIAAAATAQNKTPEQRDEFFKKEIAAAKWVFVTDDEDGMHYHIDSLTMNRVMSIVTFIYKTEKRGTVSYVKVGGGCSRDVFSVVNVMQSNPGVKGLSGGEIEDPPMDEVEKGTIGYIMLDYVCKNAKVTKVDQ
jgi:hypothetical protein